MTAIPTTHLFKKKRALEMPSEPPAALLDFPACVDVPADCDGDREGCPWRSPHLIVPGLACGQRCQFPSARPGSAGWYRGLVEKVRAVEGPVYLYGSMGGQRARLAFVDRGLLLRDDLVGSVLRIPEGTEDPEALMPKGARRDARIGERGGLQARPDTSEAAIDAFYAVYLASCERLAVRPLPRSFITHERDRAPGAFRLLLAERAGRVVGGKVYVVADGWLRIIEGSSLREEGLAELMPDVFLTREVLRDAIAEGVKVVDYGITEGVNEGLRRFKRRMGFEEDPRVVSVEELPPLSPVRQDVALLEACNFGCGFCYREPWVPNLSTEQCQAEIDAVARLKSSGIALSGGEPTIREDLPELVAYARSRGIRDIQLHTNGWGFVEHEGYAETLEAAGLTSAMISLHAHTADVFARVTSTRPEYFERTLTAIDLCRAAGVKTILSHVVNAYNYQGLPDWVRFVHERFPADSPAGPLEVFFFFVYPSVKGESHPDMYPRITEVEPYWYAALDEVDRLGLPIIVDSLAGFPPCFMRGREHHSKFSYARDQVASFGDEANDHTLKVPEMRHAAGCEGCRWEDVCPGFWIDYFARFGEDEFEGRAC